MDEVDIAGLWFEEVFGEPAPEYDWWGENRWSIDAILNDGSHP